MPDEKKCPVYNCGRPLYGEKYCIFHSEDIEGKKEQFKEAFRKEFEIQRIEGEEFDFFCFVFPDEISFENFKFEKNVDFKSAKFSGDAYFGGARFSGNANFGHVEFSREVYFKATKFSGQVNFDFAKFSEKVHFSYATFSGKSNFDYAKFSETTEFVDAKFSEKANFYATTFLRTAFFDRAEFSGQVNFGFTKFSEQVNFCFSKFSSEADFNNAEFLGMTNFDHANFSGMNSFIRAKFSGRYLMGLFESLKNKGLSRLKGIFKIKDFRFFLEPEIAQQYPVINRKIKDAWYLEDYKRNNPIVYWIWNITAKCGQSIWRWAGWSLIFSLIFAFIFYFSYKEFPLNFQAVFVSKEFPLGSFIYYSIVTFTTLGFGDIVPRTGWLQFWVMLEVILGYIMLGGLISIFANKLARRS